MCSNRSSAVMVAIYIRINVLKIQSLENLLGWTPMAATTLAPYNTIQLAANTPVQLVTPDPGRYLLNVWNIGTGHLFVSDKNNPGANVTSFEVPAGQAVPFQILIWGAGRDLGRGGCGRPGQRSADPAFPLD